MQLGADRYTGLEAATDRRFIERRLDAIENSQVVLERRIYDMRGDVMEFLTRNEVDADNNGFDPSDALIR